jgi:hypothetical protein
MMGWVLAISYTLFLFTDAHVMTLLSPPPPCIRLQVREGTVFIYS